MPLISPAEATYSSTSSSVRKWIVLETWSEITADPIACLGDRGRAFKPAAFLHFLCTSRRGHYQTTRTRHMETGILKD